MMAENFGIPRLYDSLTSAIENAPAEAVFDIAVPGSAITDILLLVPRGRAVLIQKPMGEDLSQAREILRICRERELVAAVNFQLRFAPFIIAARDMIERGMIGELIRHGGARSGQHALASMALRILAAPSRDRLPQHSLH